MLYCLLVKGSNIHWRKTMSNDNSKKNWTEVVLAECNKSALFQQSTMLLNTYGLWKSDSKLDMSTEDIDNALACLDINRS